MNEVAPPLSPAASQRPVLDLASAARQPVSVVLQELGSTQTGLTSEEAVSRLRTVGRNVLASHKVTALGVLGRQLRNPLLILLLAAAAVSAVTGDPTDGAIIAAIVVLSVGLGFINEYRSELAVAALRANIRHEALGCRDGGQQRLDMRDLVPVCIGDAAMPPVRAGRRSIMAATTRDLEAPASAMVTGSELVTITRWQARGYEQAMGSAAQDHQRPPYGWDRAARSGAVGYDLVLATPRTLSALAVAIVREDSEVTRAIVSAHHRAMGEVAHQLAVTAVAEIPVLIGHDLDSEGQPWLHTHVIYGALARAGKANPGGWLVVDRGRVEALASVLVWGYHLLVRHQLTDLLEGLGLNWTLPAADGSCADAMYRAAYQAELTRTLGVSWEAPDRWGNRAIQGMPEEVRRGFSKRHEQISAELQRQAANGKHRTAKLVQTAVHATRPPKSHETPETLYGRWQQEARVLGYEPERLVRDLTGPVRSREQDPAGTAGHPEDSGGTPAGLADVLTTTAGLPERTIKTMFDRLASQEGLTEQASTFTRREVLCAVGRELPTEQAGAVGPSELEALADRFLAERADRAALRRRCRVGASRGAQRGRGPIGRLRHAGERHPEQAPAVHHKGRSLEPHAAVPGDRRRKSKPRRRASVAQLG